MSSCSPPVALSCLEGHRGSLSKAFGSRLPTSADRPHIQHLLAATKLLASEPTLFVPPSSTASVTNALKSGSAASANKALKTPKKHVKAAPTPDSLATVMLHDLLFAKRGLTLPKEHKVRKKLEKYKPA